MARYSFSVFNDNKKSRPLWVSFDLSRAPNTDGRAGSAIESEIPRPSTQILPGKNAYRLSGLISSSVPQAVSETQERCWRTLRPAKLLKRAVDLVAASILLVLLLPFLLLVAVLVRLSGPGPIIFRQERIGAHRRPFVLLKFRTMGHSPEFSQARIDDPRVTPIGRILRRLSFDEFIQLVNVLQGDMSLVGPRPHAPETRVEGILFEEAVLSYQARYATKPGMTGLAQIRGQRGETRTIKQLEARVASDIEYIENWSIWLDFSILLKTLPAILKQENAY